MMCMHKTAYRFELTHHKCEANLRVQKKVRSRSYKQDEGKSVTARHVKLIG